MPSQEPIFVLSCERAGSTLLRYIVDAHPDICSPGELTLGHLAAQLRFTVGFTLGVGERTTAAREALKSAEARALIDGIMERYARGKGKQIWCDKSPENLRYLPDLVATYPRARYVLLHRHCLDVVFSSLEISRTGFIGTLGDYVAKSPGNVVAALTESWCDKTEAMVALEEQGRVPTHRLTYESLVQEPEPTARALFDFLELQLSPALLDRVFETPHDEGLGDPKIRYTSRIDPGSVGRGVTLMGGKQQLSPALTARANRLLAHLGYPQLDQWGVGGAGAKIDQAQARERLLSELSARLARSAPLPPALAHRYRLVVTGAEPGNFVLDLTATPARIAEGEGPSDFTVTLPSDVLKSVMEGQLNPAVGFMQGSIAGRAHVDAPPFHAVRVLRLLMP